MKLLFLCGLLVGCSASASVPAAEPNREASIQREPATTPIVQSAKAEDAAQSKSAILGGPGFWCAEFRVSANDIEYLGACYRAEPTCKSIRQKGIDDGHTVGTCEVRDSAYCFIMANNRKQAMYWRCYKSTDHCARQRHEHLGEQPTLLFSECDLMTQADLDIDDSRTALR